MTPEDIASQMDKQILDTVLGQLGEMTRHGAWTIEVGNKEMGVAFRYRNSHHRCIRISR